MSDTKRFTIAISDRQLFTFTSLFVGGFQPKGRTEETTVQNLFEEWKLSEWEIKNGEKRRCPRCGDGGAPSAYEFSDARDKTVSMTEASLKFVVNTWPKIEGKTILAVRVLLPLIEDLEDADRGKYELPAGLPSVLSAV